MQYFLHPAFLCLTVCRVRVFVWLMFLLLSLTYRFSTIILFVL